MKKDFFAHKADSYEQNKSHVSNVDRIANAVIAGVQLERHMHLMDFGSGTGLLLERIAPHVKKITAVDMSPAMNKQLMSKKPALPCDLELLEMDLETASIDDRFDGIISSMTLHHVKDIASIFRTFHALLNAGGFIALADLDQEDGSFHSEDTGVHHHGFDRELIASHARAAGFTGVTVSDASIIHKPEGDFPVFILRATRAD
ncbi:MAG: class I SAM-dependent methyltransferase [Marinobacter sp.]|nr:class I SAM-dependent methyltransferase [Marinobacter sp.]